MARKYALKIDGASKFWDPPYYKLVRTILVHSLSLPAWIATPRIKGIQLLKQISIRWTRLLAYIHVIDGTLEIHFNSESIIKLHYKAHQMNDPFNS